MKKTRYYYILVFTRKGPVYLTKLLDNKMCEWKKEDKPMQLSKEHAEDISIGLTLNMFSNVVVVSTYEIDTQPYYYEHGQFIWRRKKQNDK